MRIRKPGPPLQKARQAVGRQLVPVGQDLALGKTIHHQKHQQFGLVGRRRQRWRHGAAQQGQGSQGSCSQVAAA